MDGKENLSCAIRFVLARGGFFPIATNEIFLFCMVSALNFTKNKRQNPIMSYNPPDPKIVVKIVQTTEATSGLFLDLKLTTSLNIHSFRVLVGRSSISTSKLKGFSATGSSCGS